MFDKKATFGYDGNGKVVCVSEVHSFHDATEYASFVANAKAQKKADGEEAAKEAEEKAEAERKASEEAIQTAYYSKWRLVVACDSLILDWEIGDADVTDELKDSAIEAKKAALASDSTSCEEWLDGGIKDRYEAIFGRLE